MITTKRTCTGTIIGFGTEPEPYMLLRFFDAKDDETVIRIPLAAHASISEWHLHERVRFTTIIEKAES
jgi:hypothetical protein